MFLKEKILYSLLLLFFAALFYAYTDTPNGILIGVLAVYSFFFFNTAKEKWSLFKERKHLWVYAAFFCCALH